MFAEISIEASALDDYLKIMLPGASCIVIGMFGAAQWKIILKFYT